MLSACLVSSYVVACKNDTSSFAIPVQKCLSRSVGRQAFERRFKRPVPHQKQNCVWRKIPLNLSLNEMSNFLWIKI